jgi:hypothetical protein
MKKQKGALSKGDRVLEVQVRLLEPARAKPPSNLYGKRIENAVLNNGEQYCSDRNPSTGITWGIHPVPGEQTKCPPLRISQNVYSNLGGVQSAASVQNL